MFENLFQSLEYNGELRTTFLGLTSDTWGTGLISGLVVFLGFWLSKRYEEQKDKNRRDRIRNLIYGDLDCQLKSLDKFKTELKKLYHHLEEHKAHINLTLGPCQYFHSKIFNSIELKEVNEVIDDNARFRDLIDIYDVINFLVGKKPHKQRNDYLKALKAHLESVKNETNHPYFCETHLGLIEKSKANIERNYATIEQLKIDINKFKAGERKEDAIVETEENLIN